MKERDDRLLEILDREDIATDRLRPLFERVSQLERGHAKIAAPDRDAIPRLSCKYEGLVAQGKSTEAERVARELFEVRRKNKSLREQKAALVKQVGEARLEALKATRDAIGAIIECCGREMDRLAAEHEDACEFAPRLLPARLVKLFNRAALAHGLLMRESLITGIPGGRGNPFYPTPFPFVRPALRSAVMIRCGVPPPLPIPGPPPGWIQ